MLEVLPSRKVTRFLPRAEEVVVELDGSMARKRATRDMLDGNYVLVCNVYYYLVETIDLDLDAESSFPRNYETILLSHRTLN